MFANQGSWPLPGRGRSGAGQNLCCRCRWRLHPEKDVVCRFTGLGRLVWIQLRPVAEQVAILVSLLRFLVVQADGVYPQSWQGVYFVWLRDAVVVGVDPQP